MRIKLTSLVLILSLLIIGVSLQRCALIIHGSRKEVSIKSRTDNAKIFINGRVMGTDKVTAALKRRNDYTVKIIKSGCKTYTQSVESRFQFYFIPIYLVFFGFGVIPDAISGAWYGLDPASIETELKCGEAQD